MSELVEIEHEARMTREQAAARLRDIADQLSKQNRVELDREGVKYVVKVPSEVNLSVEVEIGDEGGEIEVEITW